MYNLLNDIIYNINTGKKCIAFVERNRYQYSAHVENWIQALQASNWHVALLNNHSIMPGRKAYRTPLGNATLHNTDIYPLYIYMYIYNYIYMGMCVSQSFIQLCLNGF